jgi:hypothetical protein
VAPAAVLRGLPAAAAAGWPGASWTWPQPGAWGAAGDTHTFTVITTNLRTQCPVNTWMVQAHRVLACHMACTCGWIAAKANSCTLASCQCLKPHHPQASALASGSRQAPPLTSQPPSSRLQPPAPPPPHPHPHLPYSMRRASTAARMVARAPARSPAASWASTRRSATSEPWQQHGCSKGWLKTHRQVLQAVG